MTTEPSSGLERRYRRLLAVWYPEEHRRQYEGEIVAVLMAGARPGQRWPSARDAANLAGYGLRARLSAADTGRLSPAWTDAAAVVALLAALVLLSQRLVRVVEHLLLPGPALPPSLALRAVAWAAVVVAILAGWRRVAALTAWLTVLAEAALLAQYYVDSPFSAATLLTPFALGVAAAVAVTVPAPRRRAFAVLGPLRLGAFALALATVHGLRLAQEAARSRTYGAGTFYTFYGLEAPSESVLYLMLGILGGAAVAGLLAVVTLPRPVRHRVYVLVAPVAVLGVSVWLHTSGDVARMSAYYWLTLAGVPLVVVTFVALAVRLPGRVARRNGEDVSSV